MKPFTLILFAFSLLLSCNHKSQKDETQERLQQKVAPDSASAEDAVFYTNYVDMPEYPGGEVALVDFLTSGIKFPKTAVRDSIEGRIYVNFEIDTTGNVTNPIIARGIRYDLDESALQRVGEMPDWEPAEKGDSLVRITYTVPVNFSLDPKDNDKAITPRPQRNKGPEFTIYPNPTTHIINLETSVVIDDLTYQILNRNGSVFDNGKLNTSPKTIDFSAFPDGLYIVRIKSESHNVLHSEKIMKQ